MTRAGGRGPRESNGDGVAFEVETLDAEDVLAVTPAPNFNFLSSPEMPKMTDTKTGDMPNLSRLRERISALEKDVADVERAYESRMADLTRRLAEADAREAERKAALRELLSKLGG